MSLFLFFVNMASFIYLKAFERANAWLGKVCHMYEVSFNITPLTRTKRSGIV